MNKQYLFIWISAALCLTPAKVAAQSLDGYTAGAGQHGYQNGQTIDGLQTGPTNQRIYQTMLQGASGPLSAQAPVLAPNSVNPAAIGQQSYSLGFPTLNPAPYTGAYRSGAPGAILPPVSTSSVDINIVDTSEFGPDGFNSPESSAAGGSGGQAGDGSSSSAPPNLPPGWTGVNCHGVYAGAIPPGGTVLAFWQGAYGFAGDAAQQQALAQEGQWLIQNGEVGP